ncbi:conserved transmembrane transport domain protein [Mycobacterium ulcerans str. Harvey]|uniref:Conserved transmembrane transport domain protein n=1 Tax=Mycobacterium ulcerans str. Harvey TaxID=1299332 RepID=A0ABN0R9C9_MYCUL|nr:conserved transmembrane transport domain protein [Mycobacterium ulcerans str. Harvey]
MDHRVFRPSSRRVRTEPALLARWIVAWRSRSCWVGWRSSSSSTSWFLRFNKSRADNSVSMNPPAPVTAGDKGDGRVFGESRSDSVALILLEGRQPLGPMLTSTTTTW